MLPDDSAAPRLGYYNVHGHPLWQTSRHPNFLGEILCWAGICLAAAVPLVHQRWVYLLAPLACFGFTCAAMLGEAVLLTELKHNRRYRDDASYLAWRRRTPLLLGAINACLPARLLATYDRRLIKSAND
jgi:steroid 5-alpha reductase family enzyme